MVCMDNNFLIHSLSCFLIPQNFSLLSLIISLLFSLFLLSFSSDLSSLQTQTRSSYQIQHHTSMIKPKKKPHQRQNTK